MRVSHISLNIYAAGAPLDDQEQIMTLCGLLPSPPYLRAVIERPARTQGSQDEAVRFVRCIGRELCVFWVPHVTEVEAAAITAACARIRKWSIEAFIGAVSRALGAKVQRLQ
jgi:hypothetical protein